MILARQKLAGKRVLVTGGTGFIGGRLAERLVLEAGAIPRVLVRQFARASRIARLPVELAGGEVTRAEDVRRAAEGCDAIVHCAYGGTTPEEQRAINVGGTRNVLDAARQAGVSRVVHVSTVAVYGLPAEGEIDETAPRRPTGDPYTDTKIEAEKLAIAAFRERHLPVVVVQPTVVYGPFGGAWTVNVLRNLSQGRQILVNGGDGVCNAVYVDDVVTALLAATVLDGILGETFLVSGPAPVTWKAFYARFEQMLGEPSTVSMTAKAARAYFARQKRRRSLAGEALAILRDDQQARARLLDSREMSVLLAAARTMMPERIWRAVKDRLKGSSSNGHLSAAAEKPIRAIHPRLIQFYASQMHVRIAKAQRMLGYQPAFSFERGMELTEQWARWANLLPAGLPTAAGGVAQPVVRAAAR